MPAAALCCLGTHKAPPGRPAPALLRLSGDLCALHGASNAVGCCGRRKRLHQGRSGVQDVRERTQSALFLMRRVERRNPSVHQCAVAAWRHMRPPCSKAMQRLASSTICARYRCLYSVVGATGTRIPVPASLHARHKTAAGSAAGGGPAAKARWPSAAGGTKRSTDREQWRSVVKCW